MNLEPFVMGSPATAIVSLTTIRLPERTPTHEFQRTRRKPSKTHARSQTRFGLGDRSLGKPSVVPDILPESPVMLVVLAA